MTARAARPSAPTSLGTYQVDAGRQTSEGVDLVPKESANDLASLTDDDSELFLFPENFRFPFFGKVYRQAVVNSDGNITFGGGDSSSQRRSENRFLAGFPRIAALFTDLNVEQGGTITSESGEDSLTFRWDRVPEFTQGPVPSQRNTFSATLFSSGNILLHYESVAVTPDEGDPTTTAIVGVTPGNLAQRHVQADLSTVAQPIRLEAAPIYEVFGPAAFDLTGADILFEAASSRLFLFFPLNESDANAFTGFAVTNYDSGATILNIEALAADGRPEPYPDNPHLEGLEGKRQLARLGSDFFDLPATASQDGWVRIGSTGTALASFFQFGSGVDGIVNRLDGSTAATETSSTLYFTRIHDGPGSFPATAGARTAETVIAIANPSEEPITVELTLFDSRGNTVTAPITREILPNGSFRETVSELFGQGMVSSGYLRATASGTGAVGFELVRLSDALLGFNAVAGNGATLSYSAQLASGLASGSAIFTNVKLVNTSPGARTVILHALAEDGSPLAAPVVRTLQPGATLQEDAGVLFDLGLSTSAPAVSGSLKVESSGPGIIGDIVFGDPVDIHYAAALPLQTRLLRRAIFSQVANQIASTAAASTFTGLALYNPGAASAQVSVSVFADDGTPTGSRLIPVPGGGRLSSTVEDLVPASAGQTGGYVEVESSQPIVAQQLFGNLTLDFLSAVPPTIVD